MSEMNNKWWTPVFWMVAGGGLVFLLAVDPLGWHGLNERLRGDAGGRSMSEEASGSESREVLFYRNPMDPTITSPVPMQDEMGMDYIAVYADAAGAGDAMAMGDQPVVTIDPSVVQNMNIRTGVAERRVLAEEVRTVGSLELDAERVVSVTTRFPGFVEKVFVNYVGEPVRRGQALFEVFSPELVQTQQELLSALDYAERFADEDGTAREHAMALVEAARTRLGYWDISSAQIERLQESGEVQRTLTVTAPAGGVVLERLEGLEGMAVRPGLEVYRIADLSALWLGIDLFENQMAWAQAGAPVEVVFNAFPMETFVGTVRFVEPRLSEQTRTLKVKVEVRDPERRLRPGMFATVRFQSKAEEPVVAVPTQAVIRTGSRSLVIVELGEGRFQPREVHVAREAGGWSEVHGIGEGERVVTSSQFLIDSEASIQAVIQGMLSGTDSGGTKHQVEEPQVDGHEGHEGLSEKAEQVEESEVDDHEAHGGHH